jgi:hypothetical protein
MSEANRGVTNTGRAATSEAWRAKWLAVRDDFRNWLIGAA